MCVRYAGTKPDEEQEYKLYVGMLDHSTSEAELRALFEPFGTVRSHPFAEGCVSSVTNSRVFVEMCLSLLNATQA